MVGRNRPDATKKMFPLKRGPKLVPARSAKLDFTRGSAHPVSPWGKDRADFDGILDAHLQGLTPSAGKCYW